MGAYTASNLLRRGVWLPLLLVTVVEDIFSVLGVDLVQNAWRGYNAALFAYGQTGAGKSHSMTGPRSDPGVLPRACDLLFHFIETQPGDITWHVKG